MAVVLFLEGELGWRGHVFNSWSGALLEKEVFTQFAEDSRLLAHSCMAHTEERVFVLFPRAASRPELSGPAQIDFRAVVPCPPGQQRACRLREVAVFAGGR